MYSWGLIPRWAKDDSIQQNTLNAKIETIHEQPSFRDVIQFIKSGDQEEQTELTNAVKQMQPSLHSNTDPRVNTRMILSTLPPSPW